MTVEESDNVLMHVKSNPSLRMVAKIVAPAGIKLSEIQALMTTLNCELDAYVKIAMRIDELIPTI